MTGQDDGHSKRDETEKRQRREEEAARLRRQRLGHVGAAAAGTVAGGIATGAAGELDLVENILGGNEAAAEVSPEEPAGEDDGSSNTDGEGELEPIDFSVEAPPEEPESGEDSDESGEPAVEAAELEEDQTFAQPDAEADPAAGLDPVPGAEYGGLPPGMEDGEDDIDSMNDDGPLPLW